MNKKTIEAIMIIVNELAKNKIGSLFVISKDNISKYYDNLYPDLFSKNKVSIFEPSTKILLMKLCDLDGAIIVSNEGIVKSYGAKIKKTMILPGHGTRHSAGRGISKIKNTISILSSEEDGMVRIFKNGKLAAEINPETGKNRKFIEKIAELFSRSEIQVATSGGVASLLLGLHPLMAGAIFTGSWIITKFGMASLKEFMKTGKIKIEKEIQDIKNEKKKK